ncbi:uncharacterized protein LOC144175156 isoform X2 [Haemaphysalis longicornis]
MSPTRDDVGTILSSILAIEKDGLSLKQLNVEYKSIVGEWIPFKDFDHSSLAAFLEGMPGVVTLRRAPNGDVVAHAARNAATAHITKMVAQQKPAKSRGPGPIRLRSQHIQRPCHWKVHPYHKNQQLQSSGSRSIAKFPNPSSTNGGIKIKTEPPDDVSPPEPEGAPVAPAPAPQNKTTVKPVPAATRRPLVSLGNPILTHTKISLMLSRQTWQSGTSGTGVEIKGEPEADISPPEPKRAPLLPTPAPLCQTKGPAGKPKPALLPPPAKQRPRSPVRSPAPAKSGTSGTGVEIKGEPEADVSPPEPKRAPLLPTPAPLCQTKGPAGKPKPALLPRPAKQRPRSPVRSPAPAKVNTSFPMPAVAAQQPPLKRPKSPISSPAEATGTAAKPRPAAMKRPEGLVRSSEPAKKKGASRTDSTAAPRQPLRARRPRSPILSPAPEGRVTTTGKVTKPANPPPARQQQQQPRRRPLSPPRDPLSDVAADSHSRWHADLPPVMPHRGPGLARPSLRWWSVFLEQAGVGHRRIFQYARALLQQGVDPSSLWLFTANDISQMGIRDHYDVHRIQEQAHFWHQYALGGPPAGSMDLDEQWRPGPASFDRGPRRRINFHDTIQEQEPYNGPWSADCDLRVIINRKRLGDCSGWDHRTVHPVPSARGVAATKSKRPYPAMADFEWERPRRQHVGYPMQHPMHFEGGPPGPRAARCTVRGREPMY